MRVNHLLFIQCLGVCFYWCASTIRIEAQVIQPTHSFPQIHHIHAISPLTENIEEYNESVEDKEDENEVDTVDLSGKFSELQDYIEDYS